MSPANTARRRLLDQVSLVGLAVFIGFAFTTFGQAALAMANLAA